MALTIINGKDGTADFKHATVSYKAQLDMWRAREVTEMTTADTFAIEGTADQEPGRSQIQFEHAGLLFKGPANTGPLIPAPQNVAITLQASTGCTLTFNANYTEASVDRLVNQNGRIGARGLSKAAYTLTWAVS